MAVCTPGRLLGTLRRAVCRPQTDTASDAELLRLFLMSRDESAFAALVRRHGPMVLGVCRRVLGNRADADDAFQATFLVLVRKASAVRAPRLLGNWLYGVAFRSALQARKARARRQSHERQASAMRRTETHQHDHADDARTVLDAALNSLPDHYRTAIVLCELEGKTRREAARQLGWPEGTVATRLQRGRALLARRLTQRGPACSVASLVGLLEGGEAMASVPPALLHATLQAAAILATETGPGGLIAGPVLALTEGVMRSMFVAKLKSLAVVMLTLAALGTGVGWTGYSTWAAEPPADSARGAKADPNELEKLRRENERLKRENAFLKTRLAGEQAAHLATQMELEHSKTRQKELTVAIDDLRKKADDARNRLPWLTTEVLLEPSTSPAGEIALEWRTAELNLTRKHEGKVTATDKSGLVTIDLGTDHGVTKGEVLEVYRVQPQPTLLGQLKILDVHKTEAVGRLTKPLKGGELQPGDKVTPQIRPAQPLAK